MFQVSKDIVLRVFNAKTEHNIVKIIDKIKLPREYPSNEIYVVGAKFNNISPKLNNTIFTCS